jgi:hypothetical protein
MRQSELLGVGGPGQRFIGQQRQASVLSARSPPRTVALQVDNHDRE